MIRVENLTKAFGPSVKCRTAVVKSAVFWPNWCHKHGEFYDANAAKIPEKVEVHRPHVVGVRGHGQPFVERNVQPRLAPPLYAQAVAPENLADGARRGRRLNPMVELQNLVQLLGLPGLVQPALGQD